MKKLLSIIVLGLLLSGNAYADNLRGKKLLCGNNKNIKISFEFTYFQKVKWILVSSDTEEFKINKSSYSTTTKLINVNNAKFYIDRKPLKLTNYGMQCLLADKNTNLTRKLRSYYNQIKEKKTKENKI